MIMRFIFLPYDAVSCLAGFFKDWLLGLYPGDSLGSIPGTIAFVGFGASIESFEGALPRLGSADTVLFRGDVYFEHWTVAIIPEEGSFQNLDERSVG